ncbi:MAG TPA: hypothetical protein QF624_04115 [Dehalococcoidia bacterium]|nr:hypothetical protein [Dehalococcoidia bacterium]
MDEFCDCRSGLPAADYHGSLSAGSYRSPEAPAAILTPHWERHQLDNATKFMRDKLGFAALPRSDRIDIQRVHMGTLVGATPVAGPDGWLPRGQAALKSRRKWVTKFASLDPDQDQVMEQEALRSIQAIESAADDAHEQLDGLEELLHHFETGALSDDTDTLERLVTAFLHRFPSGSVDLVEPQLRGFQAQTIIEQLAAADSIPPSDVLEGHRTQADLRSGLNPIDVLEVLLEPNGPRRREGFIIKQADSSLVFGFGGYLNPSGPSYRGLLRPRGVAVNSLSRSQPHGLRVATLGLAASARRQYVVRALERIQNCLWHLFDPLHFRSGDQINVIAWSGAVRSFQRIVELTWMVQTTPNDDVRRELFLGLIDLYEGFGIKSLPPMKWLSTNRSWLPPDYLEQEGGRTETLRQQIVDDIWSGIFVGVEDNQVTVPGRDPLSKESYCEEFLRAYRNGLTHGFHGRKQQPAMRGVLAVHSGIFPEHLPHLAVPMLEGLIGNPNPWIRRFAEASQ